MFIKENELEGIFAICKDAAAYYGVFKICEMKISVEDFVSNIIVRLRGEKTPWLRANACIIAKYPDELQYMIEKIELDNQINRLTYQTII